MNDDVETPNWLMIHFNKHYDPCKIKNNNPVGLLEDWSSKNNVVYVNPPYSKPLEWIKKAILESRKGVNVVLLLRCDPSTKWYRLLIENKAHIAYFNERVKFKGYENKSSNFATMLAFLEGEQMIDICPFCKKRKMIDSAIEQEDGSMIAVCSNCMNDKLIHEGEIEDGKK